MNECRHDEKYEAYGLSICAGSINLICGSVGIGSGRFATDFALTVSQNYKRSDVIYVGENDVISKSGKVIPRHHQYVEDVVALIELLIMIKKEHSDEYIINGIYAPTFVVIDNIDLLQGRDIDNEDSSTRRRYVARKLVDTFNHCKECNINVIITKQLPIFEKTDNAQMIDNINEVDSKLLLYYCENIIQLRKSHELDIDVIIMKHYSGRCDTLTMHYNPDTGFSL